MIVTVCKSCNAVNHEVIDRCKWCGSLFVEYKDLLPNAIIHSNNHYHLRGKE